MKSLKKLKAVRFLVGAVAVITGGVLSFRFHLLVIPVILMVWWMVVSVKLDNLEKKIKEIKDGEKNHN